MQKAKIIIVTGPSGAGKTTTCRKFLESANGEWAYINQDEIRQLVVAGYESADDYTKNWNEKTKKQWEVSIPICADMAKRYNEHTINCIVDIFAPPDEFNEWKKYLSGVSYELVVLLPDVHTAVARNASRDKRSRLKENKIRQNHALFESWLSTGSRVIDNSNTTLDDVIDQLRDI